MALIAGCWVLGILVREHIVQAEQIAADCLGLAIAVAQSPTPRPGVATTIRTLDLHVEGVVPRTNLVTRDDDVRERQIGVLIATIPVQPPIPEDVGQTVITANAGVGGGERITSEHAAHAQAPLIRVRG